jgi:DNA-binding NtrC family response regulator
MRWPSLRKDSGQVLFLDRRLADLDAEELLTVIRKRFPGIQVVLLDSDSTHADEDCAPELEAQEVFPASPLHRPMPRAADHGISQPLSGMIGTSEAMQNVYRMVRLVASRSTTVLIIGPTGTGKELVARALHGPSRFDLAS